MKVAPIVLVLSAATTALAAGLVWTAFPAEFQLEWLQPDHGGDGSAGFNIVNTISEDLAHLGKCAAGIGDTNGDGIDDILIGSRGLFDQSALVQPQAFVLYGGAHIDGIAEFDFDQLYTQNGADGSLGRVLYRDGVFFGESCDGIGDVNADGYNDFILFGDDVPAQQYVVFGGPDDQVGAELDLATLEPDNGGDGTRGFVLAMRGAGISSPRYDHTTGGADFNGDGIADFAAARPADDVVYVMFGRQGKFDALFDPDDLWPANGGDGSAGIIITGNPPFGAWFGDAVAMLDDFNGDAISDIALLNTGTLTFNSHVVFGSQTLPAVIDVDELLPDNGGDGSRGIVLTFSGFGAMADAGDFNGDGINDLILRGPGASGFGEAAIVYGSSTLPAVIDVATIHPDYGGDGTLGVMLTGYRPSEDDFIGSVVAGAGDLNGDGFDDVAVNGREAFGFETGDLFVVFGRDTSPAVIPLFELTAAGGGTGAGGLRITAGNLQGGLYLRLAGAGDVNADGRPDLLVTNPDAGSGFQGRAYVLYGRGDADEDGIGDFQDNCIETANPDQTDTNNDGFGNACDADLNNDLTINFPDLQLLRAAFFSSPGDPTWNEDADFDGDDGVNFGDAQVMRSVFFSVPGPSALHNDKP